MHVLYRSGFKAPFKYAARLLAFLFVTVWTANCTAQTLSAEERLAAIRNSLVEVALQGSIQVQSTAWIDAKGALQEASSFRSGMQVRGVRVSGYERDAQGEPRADVQIDSQAALTNRASESVPSPQNCLDNARTGRLQHLVALQWSVPTTWGTDELPLLESARTLLTGYWQQVASDSKVWRLIEPKDNPEDRDRSAYESALLGSGVDHTPWRLKLMLQPVTRGQRRDAQPISVRLVASLSAQDQAQPILQTSVALTLQGERGNWGMPRLDETTQYLLRQQLDAWAQALKQNLACQAVLPQVTRNSDTDIRINAGSAAGVRRGDEWLLVDDRQFPGKLLEAGVAAQSVLARVKSVAEHQAQLELLAGPAQLVQTRWRAMSTD